MKNLVCVLGILGVVLASCQAAKIDTTPNITESYLPTQTITVIPLPKYIGVTIPEAGKNYTLAEYNELATSLGWEATKPGICFSIEAYPFMEPGDFPTTDEWLGKVYLIVDGMKISGYQSVVLHGKTVVQRDEKTGEILWQEPEGSPFSLCYAAEIGIGLHTVVLVVEKTSGEQVIPYSWSFVITR